MNKDMEQCPICNSAKHDSITTCGCGYGFEKKELELSSFYIEDFLKLADFESLTGFDKKEFKNSLGTSGTNALIDGGKLAVTSLSFNVKHMLERSRREMAPYIIGGLGFTITSLDDVIITREEETDIIKSLDTGTDPFVSAGFGVNISVKNLQIFGEIRFQIIFQEDESLRYFPVKAGVVF